MDTGSSSLVVDQSVEVCSLGGDFLKYDKFTIFHLMRGRRVSVQTRVWAGESESAFVLKFPYEGGEFPSNGNDAFAVHEAAGSQGTVAFAEAVLHAPGEFFDFFALARLPGGEGCADFRSPAVSLRGFDEHPAGMGVAAFGDGALSTFTSAAVFSGDEAEEGHEFARVAKTTEVSEFADDCHGGDFLKAFAGHEGAHDGFPFPIRKDTFEVVFEAIDALKTGVDGLDVFF